MSLQAWLVPGTPAPAALAIYSMPPGQPPGFLNGGTSGHFQCKRSPGLEVGQLSVVPPIVPWVLSQACRARGCGLGLGTAACFVSKAGPTTTPGAVPP